MQRRGGWKRGGEMKGNKEGGREGERGRMEWREGDGVEEEEEGKGRVVYRSEGEGDRENTMRDEIREKTEGRSEGEERKGK